MTHASASWAWSKYDAYAESVLRKNALYAAILDCPPIRRLQNISFLGAISSFGETSAFNSINFSRYSHSVSVGYLTLTACRNLRLSPSDTNLMVAAALTHDVGHGAFSHSIEPYFRRRFGICHKHVGARIIRGDLFWGRELLSILEDFNIAPDDILAVVSGTSDIDQAYLFSNPINLDTIDGILRSASFFDSTKLDFSPLEVLETAVWPSQLTEKFGDYFWILKDTIYNKYIYLPKWAILDERINLALEQSFYDVREDHFLLTDEEFISLFGKAFEEAERNQNRLSRHKRDKPLRQLGEVSRKKNYHIKVDTPLDGVKSLHARYQIIDRKGKDDHI